MNDPRSPLQGGMTLRGGDFTIESPLGTGGFGITYRAYDHRLKRVVAVKEFFPQGCVRHAGTLVGGSGWSAENLRTQRDRFLEEGRTLARLRHPGIPMVFDIFEANETAYLVMEFVEGQTFAQYLEERDLWFLPPDEAVALIQGAGDALALMHGAQLLHRDLKPSNIMRRFDGQVMLIDFGASRDFLPEAMHTVTVIFTAGYAPLEQYTRFGNYGPSTDVYSLAATLYHLLTGQKPLEAPRRATGEVLPSPRQVNPAVPAALSDAVMHGLEIAPGQRPATVEAFLRELGDGRGRDVEVSAADTVRGSSTAAQSSLSGILTIESERAGGLPAVLPVAVPSGGPKSGSSSSQRDLESRPTKGRGNGFIRSAFKVGGWGCLGLCVGFVLGTLLIPLLPFSHGSGRRAEVVWYMQMNLALLFALWLGRRSYLNEKRWYRERLGKAAAPRPTNFREVVLSTVWGAVVSWFGLAVLGVQYILVTSGRSGYTDIREVWRVLLIVWPFLWVGFFTRRFYQKNKALSH